MTRPLRVAVAGLGTVGGGVVKLLLARRAEFAERAGRAIDCVLVSARDRKKRRSFDIGNIPWADDIQALAAADVDVVVELVGGEDGPARALVEHALASGKHVVELAAGEGLRIHEDGRATLVSNVDLERVTAWQSGKIFFDNEPLASAAERINRYTRSQIEIDPSVAALGMSGVFNAGDTNAFIEAVTAYFPVDVIRTDGSKTYLTSRK